MPVDRMSWDGVLDRKALTLEMFAANRFLTRVSIIVSAQNLAV